MIMARVHTNFDQDYRGLFNEKFSIKSHLSNRIDRTHFWVKRPFGHFSRSFSMKPSAASIETLISVPLAESDRRPAGLYRANTYAHKYVTKYVVSHPSNLIKKNKQYMAPGRFTVCVCDCASSTVNFKKLYLRIDTIELGAGGSQRHAGRCGSA